MFGPALARFSLVIVLVSACARGEAGGSVELQVGGASRTLTMTELGALPEASVLHNERRYTGVRLRDLPGPLAAGATLRATAADGYEQTLAPEVVAREDALLAWAVDGGPLADSEGPLRLVVPGSRGLSLKQLVRLDQL